MDDALSLDGRAAIVTGAGNGLGRAEALALAAAGRASGAQRPGRPMTCTRWPTRSWRGGGQAVGVPADIGEWATGQRLVAAAAGHVRAAWTSW